MNIMDMLINVTSYRSSKQLKFKDWVSLNIRSKLWEITAIWHSKNKHDGGTYWQKNVYSAADAHSPVDRNKVQIEKQDVTCVTKK